MIAGKCVFGIILSYSLDSIQSLQKKAYKNDQAWKATRCLGEKIHPFIELFDLDKNKKKKATQETSLDEGILVLKEVADNTQKSKMMHANAQEKGCPQGPDLALTKPARDAIKMIHDSFRKIRSRLHEEGLQHIAEDLSFTSFTTLDPDRSFGGMRTPSRPTPDMHDYTTRRPCCCIESVEKNYHSSFVFYTGSQSHYVQRRVHAKEPEWLYQRAQEHWGERPAWKGYANTPGQGQTTFGGQRLVNVCEGICPWGSSTKSKREDKRECWDATSSPKHEAKKRSAAYIN